VTDLWVVDFLPLEVAFHYRQIGKSQSVEEVALSPQKKPCVVDGALLRGWISLVFMNNARN